MNGFYGTYYKFYFVTPENLISKEDIPEGLGLIYYNIEHKTFKIVKNASLLHKNKIQPDEYRNMAKKLSFRENNQRMLNFELKKENEELKNGIVKTKKTRRKRR